MRCSPKAAAAAWTQQRWRVAKGAQPESAAHYKDPGRWHSDLFFIRKNEKKK